MKKFIFLIIMVLSCQSALADFGSNFDYMNIETESFSPLNFKKTTLAEFKTKYQNFKPINLDENQVMLVSSPKTGDYSEIRVGFNKNVVEWIEFILKEKADFTSFLSRYGDTTEINQNYNEIYDYYNYDIFNVSVDKQGKYLYSITLFANPKMPEEMTNLDKKLPDVKNIRNMQTFIPKEYLEETFSDNFDCLYPEFNDDGTKTYTVKDNIISKYSKAEFIFKDGLLKFLVLYPQNTTFEQIANIYGKNFKIDKTTKNKIIYDYGDFYVLTDLKNNVVQIAID